MVLILSHGQASVERGFSINSQVMVENLKKWTFIVQRTIHDHLLHIAGLDALVVDKPLPSSKVHRVPGTDKAKSAKGVKRKTLSDEITALEKRRKTVQWAMMSMTTHSHTLSEQAEAQNDMTLSMKSNAFRRSAKEKDEEHASLAKKICETL